MLVRSVTTTESEWTPAEVAWMTALDAYEAGQCPRCRGVLAETTDPDRDFNNIFGTAFYTAAPGYPRMCHCCAAIDRSEQSTRAQNPQHPAAILHAVHLVRRG